MFGAINNEFNRKKRALSNDELIAESVLSVDEVIPGSEDEIDDQIDVDSVPDEVYRKIDSELDKIIDDPNYDDTEAEELLDGDDEDISDEDLDAIIDEACNKCWYDDENLGHPDTGRRSTNTHQPIYKGDGQKSL